MRLIDADAFKTWIDEYVSVFKKSDKAEIKGYISHQPSIDLVRCKECVHWKADKFFCKMFHVGTPEDGYCYMAKTEQTEREGE